MKNEVKKEKKGEQCMMMEGEIKRMIQRVKSGQVLERLERDYGNEKRINFKEILKIVNDNGFLDNMLEK